MAPLLDDLAARGLQSDERYAEAYVEQRVRRGYGPMRIRAELRERGIGEALIESWLDDDRELWISRLDAVLASRFGAPARDQRELARQARFLERRGFPGDLIRRRLLD